MTLRYCGNRGNRNTSGKILEHHMQNVCWKLKFQQQILKYLNVLQWDRKKLWRRSCPYCFPGTTVKCAASSKIPKSSNMRNVSKYVSHKNLQPQLLKWCRWSHSPRSRETSKTDNFATAPLRLWTNPQKNNIFATRARAVAVFQSKLTS